MRRLPASLVASLAGVPLTLLARSWRIELAGAESFRRLVASRTPYVLLTWHDALLPLLWQHRRLGITMVVSEAAEGRYLAAYARRLGYGVAFGSSTRGGVRAMLGAMRALLRGEPAAFTPDGPRGPRRVLKGGVLRAAQRGGAWVVPLHAGSERGWRLRTWDRLLVPGPLARVRIAYAEPFQVGPGLSGIEAAALRAGEALETVVREVRWDDAVTATG
ncbi:MAG TPA: DUF374 domain-containing protein [Gemmatimonadales bacterium]|nr:DUF374 domain-containing protein [Gemmatimonadales bacterium]